MYLVWIKTCFLHLYLKAEKAQQREKNLEEARKITIKEDESLPKARRVSNWYNKNVGYKKLAYSARQFSKIFFNQKCFFNHRYWGKLLESKSKD